VSNNKRGMLIGKGEKIVVNFLAVRGEKVLLCILRWGQEK